MSLSRIGIIGGGQLGKMMILDAKRLGFYIVILDPAKDCPSHSIADEHIVADFDDFEAFKALSKKVDIITYEFEHICVESLEALEAQGSLVYPSSETLKCIQNKLIQKEWLLYNQIPVPTFQAIDALESLEKATNQLGFPIILKTCTGGYDGKGNYVIQSKEDIKKAYETLGKGEVPLMVEAFIPFVKEISVLVCKGHDGASKVFPIAENKHVHNILDETIVPARISKKVEEKAMHIANKIVSDFSTYGMLCIEMFVTKEDEVLVNELAPRPHNSGHYTIEGCYTSQFEQHMRGIAGLPLGDTGLREPTVMKNLLGASGAIGRTNVIGLQDALLDPRVKLHIYGKTEAREGRKMGHITACDKTVEGALKRVRQAYNIVKICGKKEGI